MKYNIISVNDSRAQYKNAIRRHNSVGEVKIPSTNGMSVNIDKEFERRGLLDTNWIPKIGEAGCWVSHFDCWSWSVKNNEELIVFEDDAIIDENFVNNFDVLYSELPSDYDFCSLWVPDNQRQDFYYVVEYDSEGQVNISGRIEDVSDSHFDIGCRFLARAYQGYGLVATLYSPQGAKRLIEQARRRGVCTPVDCFIFQESHAERVKGYAPKPHVSIVQYDWNAETTVHNTGVINAV